MSAEFTYLVQLYGRAVLGQEAFLPTAPLDWEKVLSLACEQSITGTVAMVLKKAPFCPSAVREECTRLSLGAALKNVQKTETVLDTVDALLAAGFHPMIIKGLDIGRFYAHPECRSSADSDILIPPQEEQPVLAMLADRGYTVIPRREGNHHAEASHPCAGILEVHVQLYDDMSTTGLLGDDGARNATPSFGTQVDFSGRMIPVLCPADALLFLAVHTVKHFVSSGITLRQGFDFALYFSRCAGEIDTDIFWEQMERYGFGTFLQKLLWTFVQYGCFSAGEFPGLLPQTTADSEAILQDMELTPTYEPRDISTWEYFYFRHNANAGGQVQATKRRRYRKKLLHIAFPSMGRLAEKYPYLKGRPLLYPVAWLHRLFQAFTDRDRRQGLLVSVNLPNAASLPAGEDDPTAWRLRLLERNGLMR